MTEPLDPVARALAQTLSPSETEELLAKPGFLALSDRLLMRLWLDGWRLMRREHVAANDEHQ